MRKKFQFIKEVDLESLVIEGERITLRPIVEKYAPVIFHEFNDEITHFMFPKPAGKIEETLDFIRSSKEGLKGSFDIVFSILDKKNEEFLGCCGFHGKEDITKPELGIWIKKCAHGKKYGREAVFAVTRWALENVEFDYLIYPVDKKNIASRKIPESLGGIVFQKKKVKTMRGTTLDEVVYKISKENLNHHKGFDVTAYRSVSSSAPL